MKPHYAYDLDEIVDPIPKPGFMEKYERDSLKEIKVKLAERGYRDAIEVREHMLFLERLADKMQAKISCEVEEGETGWNLKRDQKRVLNTFELLGRLLDKLE